MDRTRARTTRGPKGGCWPSSIAVYYLFLPFFSPFSLCFFPPFFPTGGGPRSISRRRRRGRNEVKPVEELAARKHARILSIHTHTHTALVHTNTYTYTCVYVRRPNRVFKQKNITAYSLELDAGGRAGTTARAPRTLYTDTIIHRRVPEGFGFSVIERRGRGHAVSNVSFWS